MIFDLPTVIRTNDPPLRNREPATIGYANAVDEPFAIVEGSTMDLSGLRLSAVPAGNRGRIRIHQTDPTKFAESALPTTAVKIYVATWAPDISEVPLPGTKEEITHGCEHLARMGFNAVRIHGLEYWMMAGSSTPLNFPAESIDRFDWFLAECKRLGIYWILNPRQPELYQAGPNRFNMPSYTKNYKQRIFVQQDARDNWRAGFEALYNRINPYTGINILQDRALFQVECFNECTASFVAQNAWPDVWVTRDAARGTGAYTWREWLADPAMAHGYANLAALNASWGTAYASFNDIPAPSGTNLPNLNLSATQQSIDVTLYCGYLDDELAVWFQGQMAEMGYTGLISSTINFPSSMFLQSAARNAGNSMVNLHNYPFLAQTPAPGANLGVGVQNLPIWEWESWMYTAGIFTSNKPSYVGEYGWPYWGQYRNQYPMLGAFLAMQGAPAVSYFYQGDFFATEYSAGQTPRVRALYPLAGHTDPAMRFGEVVMFFAFARGYVTEATATKTLILNTRYYGTNPRNTARIGRAFFNMFLPVMLYGGLTKTYLNWTADTTDDSLNNVELAKSWATITSEALSGTGFSAPAITASNDAYVSAQANNGTITAVATSGVIGSVTATETQPVLTLAPGNTLVNGDQIGVLSLTGTVGPWPGTSNRGTRATILQTGVANRVQITSGLNLTGCSGFTAGTWSEFANEMESGTGELFVSRRRKFVAIDAAKLKFLAVGIGATVPTMTGISGISIPALSAFFVASLDGADIATSTRLLCGVCGNPRNTGDTFSANNTVLDTVGGYPIQLQDDTVSFTLNVASPGDWRQYRLQANGERNSRESLVSVNVAAGTISVQLRTGSVYPTLFFELTRV